MDKEIIQKPVDKITVKENAPIQPFVPGIFPFPFIRFSMSKISMSSDGKTTHSQAEQHQYENGKLDSQQFEGTLAGDFMSWATRLMEQQMALFFKSFNMFLPFK